MQRHPWSAALGVLLFGLLACTDATDATGPSPQPEPPEAAVDELPRQKMSVGMHVFDVEVADTPARKSRGLGGHAPLGPNEGMVFPYERPGLYSFWMKDMLFDIDIVWIHGDRVVGITENVPHAPETKRPPIYRPPEPSDLILELAAGTAAAKGLTPGMPVSISPDPRGASSP
ncbi:MAG: DUF192 domain-containing protein [Myxococcota bacterium]|nr:DUF192 domain-containing protein [Myxococcota bacterium]